MGRRGPTRSASAADATDARAVAARQLIRPASAVAFKRTKARPLAGHLPPLPVELNSFIGRESEIGQLGKLLTSTRLLTLTGEGGVGKTRLALRLAGRVQRGFPDGVILVELADVPDARLVPETLAEILGVHRRRGGEVLHDLVDALKGARALVLLDNCEHLVGACAALVESLLRSCPDLKVLATSREPLDLSAELTWRVPSLSIPGRRMSSTAAKLAQYDAVRLFVDRAHTALPSFVLSDETAPHIAKVCRAVDGIPLALELAASRVRVLTVEQIADKLDAALRFLPAAGRSAPLRQRTLRATLDWSYQLLTRREQSLFDRLSVFVDGCTLEAAEAVAVGAEIDQDAVLDLLAALVGKSLQLAEQGQEGPMRYRMLKVVAQYGQEHLAARGEAEDVRSRHAQFFVELAERAEPHMFGSDTVLWFKRLDGDRGNLRAALRHLVDRGDIERGLRLGGAVWRFWYVSGTFAESSDWLALLTQLSVASTRSAARAKALNGAGCLAGLHGDFESARKLLEESLSVWQTLGNPLRIVGCINNLAGVAREVGDYARAYELYDQVLASPDMQMDPAGIAMCLNSYAWALAEQGEYERAQTLSTQSVSLSRELGDALGMTRYSTNLAWCVLQSGDPATAGTILRQSLEVIGSGNMTVGIVECLHGLAAVAARTGHSERAIRLAAAAAELQHTIQQPVFSHAHGRRVASWLEPIRQAVDAQAFAVAWAQGEALSGEQAVAYALAADDASSARSLRGSPEQKGRFMGLSAREREVAMLLAGGRSNKEIASALVIATSTAERHVANILNKLKLSSRAEVAAWAVRTGLAAGVPEQRWP